MIPREWSEWTRQLDEEGGVELRAGENVIVRVDHEGVWLPPRDLRIPWQYLGFADGYEQERFSPLPHRFVFIVSRRWWAAALAAESGDAPDVELERLAGTYAEVEITYRSRWRKVPAEAFGEWLSAQAIDRAPLPERLGVTPAAQGVVFDRDTNRPVPLDTLPVTHELRARLAGYGEAGGAVPADVARDETTWDAFKSQGRDLARELESQTGRPAAVWWDCPDVP